MSNKRKTICSTLVVVMTITILLLSASCEQYLPALDPSNIANIASQTSLTKLLRPEKGYLSAEYEGLTEKGSSFLACGTEGRLDRIYADGTVENLPVPTDITLTGILKDPNITMVSGDAGTILYSYDGYAFANAEVASDSDITEITPFNGNYFAAAASGEVLKSSDGISWMVQSELTGSAIISICSNNEYMMAITSETDIFISKDGNSWTHQNFNAYYDGYYEKYVFTKMQNLGSTFFVLGFTQDDPGIPLIMFSSDGEIWLFKSLDEIDDKDPSEYYPLKVNSIGVFIDQLITTCNSGRVLTVTECSVCNYVMNASSADLYDMALNDEQMLVVGDNYEFALLSDSDIRKNEIKPEPDCEGCL